MVCSEIAIKVLAAKECGYIKTTTRFWKEFYSREMFETSVDENKEILQKAKELKAKFDLEKEPDSGMLCVFDEGFPCINPMTKNSEKPYLLFYRGNIELLQTLNNNVAVIGLIDPTENIETRERKIVEKLIESKLVIVSGLAKGCDEIAHRVCVENKAKTIAILPTSLAKIAPASNRVLADRIVETGGLLVTEYYQEAESRNEAIGRYIERDRLQALFSKAVIMIASYNHGDGDSGSRHAMKYAESFATSRFVMYQNTDNDDIQFGLNRYLLSQGGVSVITPNHIEELKVITNDNLTRKAFDGPQQLSLI